MMVRAICRDGWRRHILPRRHFALRHVGCFVPAFRDRVAFEIPRIVVNRPRPPFSLSGTIQVLQFSNSFYHFVAGELLLALLLRSRTEWSRLYPPRLDVDGVFECCAGQPLAAEANQIAARRLHDIPSTDQGAAGSGVGTRLDLLA